MQFDWDDSNFGHIEEHGVLPEEAVEAYFNGLVRISFQLRHGEFRRVAVGRTDAGRFWWWSTFSGTSGSVL